MAVILRGKRRGETVELHQWANDWFTLADGAVISPISIQLNPDEIDLWDANPCGMDTLFQIQENGTFRKIKWRIT